MKKKRIEKEEILEETRSKYKNKLFCIKTDISQKTKKIFNIKLSKLKREDIEKMKFLVRYFKKVLKRNLEKINNQKNIK